MFGNDWDELLKSEFQKEYFVKLKGFLVAERANHTVFPPKDEVFNALRYTAYQDVKVVILGQDPYHGEGQAHGLAFSVKPGVDAPPSLVNIYKELQSDLGIPVPNHGNLVSWAKQGVLLLNTALTVRKDEANSHRNKGWEIFTDRIISLLNEREKPMVFLLWGRNAAEKEELVSNQRHMVLKAPHPSPLSAHRGFLGCRHFSKTNAVLRACGETPIDWKL
ncbi:MAG: uracil-DNA glycosylase [Ruminococcaceae bacterium]|nr:uracil-DNA glycosylase [Oscillospiraceae bacterium]